MACTDYDSNWEAFANISQAGGQALLDGVNCAYQDQVGMGIFAAVVFGTVALAYIAVPGSRSSKLGGLAVLAMVVGPIAIPLFPAAATQLTVFVIIIAIAMAFYYLYARREQSF